MQETNNNSRINLVDLFLYMLGHWYWFVLCVALCAGYAYWKYAKTPFTYRADATIIIKDPSNTRMSVSMSTYSGMINKVNMTNEILQLRSKQLMTETVKSLNADISYTLPIKLRNVELYQATPVKMTILPDEGAPDYLRLTVTTLDPSNIKVELPDGRSARVALGDTIPVGNARVIFTPTRYYHGEASGKPVTITKQPVWNAVSYFLSRLSISQSEGTILRVSLQDYSAQRACDIINTLIVKYNEDAIREKNRVAVNTALFINERLMLIQQELGGVEDEIAQFKAAERITDANAASTQYLNESKQYSAQIVKTETQLKLAEFLRDFITASFESYETIPVNTGLEDAKIENEITQYNSLLVQRERLLKASSEESPAVKQTEATLLPLRQSILGSINNLITTLEVQRNDLSDQEHESLRKFTTMPAKARQLLSIERQQKIMESLYIYLLNKREENALTQTMVDNNARMIDNAAGTPYPINPNRNRMLLIGLLVGLLIPAVILFTIIFLDNKIRTRRDLVDEGVQTPFLAELPKAKMKKPKKGEKPDPKHTAYSHSFSRSFTESMS